MDGRLGAWGHPVSRSPASNAPNAETDSESASSPSGDTSSASHSSSTGSPALRSEGTSYNVTDNESNADSSSDPENNTSIPAPPAQPRSTGSRLRTGSPPRSTLDAAAAGHARRTPTTDELAPPETIRAALDTWLDLISRPLAPLSEKRWVQWASWSDLSAWQPSGATHLWPALQEAVAAEADKLWERALGLESLGGWVDVNDVLALWDEVGLKGDRGEGAL